MIHAVKKIKIIKSHRRNVNLLIKSSLEIGLLESTMKKQILYDIKKQNNPIYLILHKKGSYWKVKLMVSPGIDRIMNRV